MTGFFTTLVLVLQLALSVPAFAITVTTGSYTGNGSSQSIVTSPACQPSVVIVRRDGASQHAIIGTSVMASGNAYFLTTTDTGATNRITAYNANGFSVGSSSTTNSNGNTHYYLTICDNGLNDLAIGTFTGDGTSPRSITISPAFQPEVVILLHTGSGRHTWRGATSHPLNDSSLLNLAEDEWNGGEFHRTMNANGFDVGSLGNANGTVYYYLALKGSASGVASGNITGNGSSQTITVSSFTPEFAVIKGNSVTAFPAYRFGSQVGDSAFVGSDAAASGVITSFGSGSIGVGSSSASNESGITMRWFALTDVAAAGRRPIAPIILN